MEYDDHGRQIKNLYSILEYLSYVYTIVIFKIQTFKNVTNQYHQYKMNISTWWILKSEEEYIFLLRNNIRMRNCAQFHQIKKLDHNTVKFMIHRLIARIHNSMYTNN